MRDPIGGWFTWRPSDGGRPLLVAGGSGIAPLMAMIRQRAALRTPAPVGLFYSSRAYDEINFREEWDRLAAMGGELVVAHTLTRSQLEGWSGRNRRIDRAMLEEFTWDAEEHPLTFVCGPTPLVESVESVESVATTWVEMG
jgi:ferredoxin-NADP reductase